VFNMMTELMRRLLRLCVSAVVGGDCDSSTANEDLHASLNKLCISMIGAALDSSVNDPLWSVVHVSISQLKIVVVSTDVCHIGPPLVNYQTHESTLSLYLCVA